MAKKGAKLIDTVEELKPFTLINEFLIMRHAQEVTPYIITSFGSALNGFFNGYKGNIKDSRKLRQEVYAFFAVRAVTITSYSKCCGSSSISTQVRESNAKTPAII
jgi:hypothetical protein